MLLACANAIFEHFDYFAIFSRSHMLDPALQDFKARIRERYAQRGEDEGDHTRVVTISAWLPYQGGCHITYTGANEERMNVHGGSPNPKRP